MNGGDVATRTNLELAVKEQAKNLDPAQKEFVLTEFKTYMWNEHKIVSIQNEVDSGEMPPDLEKKKLAERHQLVCENSALFGHIMRWLKGTAPQESELDSFLNG